MATSSKKKKIIFFSVLGTIVLILAVILITSSNKEKIVQVQTEKVTKRNITQVVAGTGTIDAVTKVVITPEVTGEIVELPVIEGQYVKKGQLLIRIRSNQYQAAVERTEAMLRSAKSSLNSLKANLDKSLLDFRRIEELRKKNLASSADFEAAQNTYLSAKGQYEAQQGVVAQNQAAVQEEREALGKTSIYSPIDGTVVGLNVKLGERVLGSNFTQGTDIMTVANLKDIEAVININENDVVNVKLGNNAQIEVDAFKGKKFSGKVTEISNTSTTSGAGTQEAVVNFKVKIRLAGDVEGLRPGMSCNADIETAQKFDVLSVPIQSVTARTAGAQPESEDSKVKTTTTKSNKDIQEIVFLNSNGLAKIKNVKTGISDDNYIEITDGLSEGMEIITGPYKAVSNELEDNTKVKLQSEGPKGKK